MSIWGEFNQLISHGGDQSFNGKIHVYIILFVVVTHFKFKFNLLICHCSRGINKVSVIKNLNIDCQSHYT